MHTDMHTGRGHVKLKAERGAASIQAKGCQRLQANPQGQGRGTARVSLRASRRSQACGHFDLVLQLCRTASQSVSAVEASPFAVWSTTALENSLWRRRNQVMVIIRSDIDFFKAHLPPCLTALKKMMLLEKRKKKVTYQEIILMWQYTNVFKQLVPCKRRPL